MVTNCPVCEKEYTQTIFCNNDCGTFICGNCKNQWFLADHNVEIQGHDPDCGKYLNDPLKKEQDRPTRWS